MMENSVFTHIRSSLLLRIIKQVLQTSGCFHIHTFLWLSRDGEKTQAGGRLLIASLSKGLPGCECKPSSQIEAGVNPEA